MLTVDEFNEINKEPLLQFVLISELYTIIKYNFNDINSITLCYLNSFMLVKKLRKKMTFMIYEIDH